MRQISSLILVVLGGGDVIFHRLGCVFCGQFAWQWPLYCINQQRPLFPLFSPVMPVLSRMMRAGSESLAADRTRNQECQESMFLNSQGKDFVVVRPALLRCGLSGSLLRRDRHVTLYTRTKEGKQKFPTTSINS